MFEKSPFDALLLGVRLACGAHSATLATVAAFIVILIMVLS